MVAVIDSLEEYKAGTKVWTTCEWMAQQVLRTEKNGPKCLMTQRTPSMLFFILGLLVSSVSAYDFLTR